MRHTIPLIIVCITLLLACKPSGPRMAAIETEFGTMKVELYDETPLHRDNFIKLADEGYYDDLLFHRIMQGFMIQGGDPKSKNAAPGARLGMGGPGYLVDAEIGAPHFKGCLAAARTGGASNPQKKSSGSQYYIVQGRPQQRASLERMAQSKGFTYNEAQIAKYEKLGGTPGLDGDYTVFGEVVEGLEIIDKLAAVETDSADRPLIDRKMKVRMLN